ncbi:SDR family NAD(P)-dependent oxidoreductase [Leucobacter soli]|uniref:SDR family NAD(P)-dependent oxidoreductase n=1 Tax=Leucobacter soli TaxID=2812850 RepID=UPI00360A56BE
MGGSPVAIVTGAGAGIGLAIARRLVRDGFRLGLCDLDTGLPDAFAAEIADGRAFAVVGDISDERVRDELIGGVRKRFGRLDALVNNAASGGQSAEIAEMDLATLRRTLDINVVAVVALTQAAVPLLEESGRGASSTSVPSSPTSPSPAAATTA